MVKGVFYGVGQGSVTVPRYAALLFRYNELIRDAQALEYGIFACDVSLGVNPSGMSWVTGLGSNSVQHPLHVALPPEIVLDAPSGVPVFGPCEAPRLYVRRAVQNSRRSTSTSNRQSNSGRLHFATPIALMWTSLTAPALGIILVQPVCIWIPCQSWDKPSIPADGRSTPCGPGGRR